MSAANAPVQSPWLDTPAGPLRSRLVLGIEQYTSAQLIADVLTAGGCDAFITTFDLRSRRSSVPLFDVAAVLDVDAFTWVGTTSFARSEDEALRTVEMLHSSFAITTIKLDVRGGDNAPDVPATVRASRKLCAQGFTVLPLVPPDVGVVAELAGAGCAAVRLVASPVGSARGIDDPGAMRLAIEAASVPVVVECGIGSVAHAAQAMELGADAVLVNAAVVRAADPARMAAAMRHAVLGGRLAAGQATGGVPEPVGAA
ncbi:thiamine biosynthesis protein ThiG [Actinomycetes bacterium KLBMP 9759]